MIQVLTKIIKIIEIKNILTKNNTCPGKLAAIKSVSTSWEVVMDLPAVAVNRIPVTALV